MYEPEPIDTSGVELPQEVMELAERLARSTHDNWARGRMIDGWTYGPVRDDKLMQTPCLVPYEELPEREKDFDRITSLETLKAIYALGYRITRADR